VVPEPRAGKDRPHRDLSTSDLGAEVDRLIGTGAESYPRTSGPDEDLVTLVDPGGNLFDVIQKGA
jgi:hypothetical protein